MKRIPLRFNLITLIATCWPFFTSAAVASFTEGTLTTPVPSALIGIWQQTDSARFLVVTAEAADFYHYNRFACYKDEAGSGKPLAASYARYHLGAESSMLTLFCYDFGDRFDGFFAKDEFRRIPALPASTVTRPGEDARFKNPEFIFEIVWHHFDEQFGFFKQRGFDWQESYRRFRPKVTARTTDEELYQVLTGMLTGLGDSHTRVYWDKKTEPFRSGTANVLSYLDAAFERQSSIKESARFRGEWARQQKSAVETKLAQAPFARAAGDRIRWGKLHGNVGYLELDRVTDFGPPGSKREIQMEILERDLDHIIENLLGCQAVIIDLSFNQGGFDGFGATIVSRFADTRRHAISVYTTGEDASAARPLFIGPGGPRQFTGPVYVLTSNSTVSGGETLTLMLRAFPQVKHVGETTRGCLSSFLNKSLPHAFHITLSNEFWLAPDGTLFEGPGIKPHIEFPVFTEAGLMTSYPQAVRKTLNLATTAR